MQARSRAHLGRIEPAAVRAVFVISFTHLNSVSREIGSPQTRNQLDIIAGMNCLLCPPGLHRLFRPLRAVIALAWAVARGSETRRCMAAIHGNAGQPAAEIGAGAGGNRGNKVQLKPLAVLRRSEQIYPFKLFLRRCLP